MSLFMQTAQTAHGDTCVVSEGGIRRSSVSRRPCLELQVGVCSLGH